MTDCELEIEPIQIVVFKFSHFSLPKAPSKKLNLYKLLYLNISVLSMSFLLFAIEPIQIVVFKYRIILLLKALLHIEPIQIVVFK